MAKRWDRTTIDLGLSAGAEILQKLGGYVVLAILARHFDKARMGELFFGFSLGTIVSAATELGTSRYLVRTVAVSPALAAERLGEVLSLRSALSVAAFVLVAAGAYGLHPASAPVVVTAVGATLLGNLYYVVGAVLVGQRQVGLRVATGLAAPAASLAAVLSVIGLGGSFQAVLLAYATASGVPLVVGLLVARRLLGRFSLAFDPAAWSRIMRVSLPFFLLSALGLFHFKADTLLLFTLASPVAVATYETGYKLLEASRIAVRPTDMVFLPIGSALAADQKWVELGALRNKLLSAAGGLGVLAGLGLAASAGLAVPLLWGDAYGDTIPVVHVLALAVPSVFVGFVATYLAVAMQREQRAVRVLAAALVANVLLNLWLIPRLGALGAAWATVATETLAAILLLRLTFHVAASQRDA
jgi:O-antigen/teichoic acid export membrane protein